MRFRSVWTGLLVRQDTLGHRGRPARAGSDASGRCIALHRRRPPRRRRRRRRRPRRGDKCIAPLNARMRGREAGRRRSRRRSGRRRRRHRPRRLQGESTLGKVERSIEVRRGRRAPACLQLEGEKRVDALEERTNKTMGGRGERKPRRLDPQTRTEERKGRCMAPGEQVRGDVGRPVNMTDFYGPPFSDPRQQAGVFRRIQEQRVGLDHERRASRVVG